MIQLPREDPNRPNPARVVVIGVGNAGVGFADQLTLAGLSDRAEIAAVNTDASSLSASVVSSRVLIGSRTARGLGTGGDPDLGADAADESLDDLTELLQRGDLVILCAGLGGGTGSGAVPAIAAKARDLGATVIALCTLPFSFEGKRRNDQAADARDALRAHTDALFLFENDRMSEIAEPLAGLHETFASSDQTLSAAIAALVRLTDAAGPFPVSLRDLTSIFRTPADSALFGTATASGSNRAHEAVETALKNPLLNRGKGLAKAASILVRIEGSADLSLAEVQAIMQSVGRLTDDSAALHLGVGLNPNLNQSVTVSILAATGESKAASPKTKSAQTTRTRPEPPPKAPEPVTNSPEPDVDDDPEEFPAAPEPEPEYKPVTRTPRRPVTPTDDDAIPPTTTPDELFDTDPFTVTKAATPRKSPKPKQEVLHLDAASRGRFEKSEPTIVGGENLDVPTFMRQKLRLS